MAGLTCPRSALIGPWGHTYPWMAQTPDLDWTADELRWWRHWLQGEPTGLMDEPQVRAFIPYASPIQPGAQAAGGRWVSEPAWPPVTTDRLYHLNPGALDDTPRPPTWATVSGDVLVGLTRPQWLDRPPLEQSWDDARSLRFDTEPLAEDLEILGYPCLRLTLASDQPVATIALRLNEVTADSRSWAVTWAVRNLTHRDSHTEPWALTPGEPVDLDLPLALIGHRFKKGSRIRLAVSAGLWPLVWPAPVTATLTLALGDAAVLSLPIRTKKASPEPSPIIEPSPAVAPEQPDQDGWYNATLESSPTPAVQQATGLTLARGRWETSRIRQDDPNSGAWTHRLSSSWQRGDWLCSVEASCELTSTPDAFHLTERLFARLGDEVIFDREHCHTIPRDLM